MCLKACAYAHTHEGVCPFAEQLHQPGLQCSILFSRHASRHMACITCRGLKRQAPLPYQARPPYKLVPVGSSSLHLIPAVVHGTALPPAKQRRVGVGRGRGAGSTGNPGPWGMLAPGYPQTHVQRPVTARSLFHYGVQGMVAPGEQGGQCALGWSLSAWQKQQRVVLQCVLQQIAALRGFKPAVIPEQDQVAFFSGT